MQTSDVAPSRKLIWASGDVKPSGPHHCLTYSGSDQAFQTSESGALKRRVTTRSRLLSSVILFSSVSYPRYCLHLTSNTSIPQWAAKKLLVSCSLLPKEVRAHADLVFARRRRSRWTPT